MLHRDHAALVVVDVQSRLLPSIHGAEELVGQIVRLIRGFRIVGGPILVTEQYPKGLGETDRRILEAVSPTETTPGAAGMFEPLGKMTMSCMLDDRFRAALKATGCKQIVLCGIESHVCVHQTALHLLEHGFHVEVVADAVSSRSPGNREIALQRMSAEGVKLSCVEMAIFEMLERCGTDRFRSWVDVIR